MSCESGLPKRPRVPKHFNIVPMSDGRIQLRSAHKTVLLSGKSIRAVEKLLGLLDGTRSVPEITGCFPDIPEDEVLMTLRKLADRGLVEDATEAADGKPSKPSAAYDAQKTFFSLTSRDGRALQAVVQGCRVAVFGLGRVGSHLVAALARAGVGGITAVDETVVEESLPVSGGLYLREDVGRPRGDAMVERVRDINPSTVCEIASAEPEDDSQMARIVGEASLAVVCRDNPEVAIYRSVNRAALREGVPWLRVSLEGFEAQLGPAVIPYETACYTCYELRTKANWSYYEENLAFEEHLLSERPKADYGCLAPASGFLGNLAALESLKILTGFAPPMTCGRLLTFNISTFDAHLHEVLKLPRCPSCGATVRGPSATLWFL